MMKQSILKSLGYSQESVVDDNTNALIDKALREVEEQACFKYIYQEFAERMPFLEEHPSYQNYLRDRNSYLLVATTLGVQIDRYTQRLQLTDLAYAMIFDAAANVYLECQADDFERKLPYTALDFRFCPGYGGTQLTDNRIIADTIKASCIGISFLQSGLMVPLKSMVGIVAIGSRSQKSCDHCIAKPNCNYRKRNTTCYTKS